MAPAKSYAEMKDSGIEWLGKIPNDWCTIRVKYAFKIKKEIAGKLGHTVLSVTQRGIKPKDMSEKGQFSLDYSRYQLVDSGDFVMNHMDLLTGWVDISNMNGVTSPDYRVFQSSNPEKYYPDYYRYVFQTCYQQRIFYGFGQGVSGLGRWRLPAEIFLNFYLPVPPYDIQSTIASYLNTQCSKIDEIIAQAKASIEDYKRWKASIIYEAVTKGLDPNVEMKDSGIEWIKQIPQHWGKSKIKKVAQAFNGDRSSNYPSGDDIVSSGILFITSNNLGAIELNIGIPSNKYITPQKYNELRGAKVQINDIVFCLRGSVGKCSINKQIMEGTIASSLVIIRAESINPDYLNYVLQNSAVSEMALTTAIGIGSLNLSAENIMSFVIPLPSPAEQSIIVRYLNHKCKTVEGLITEKQSLIDDLESYKKSLIYEVVTGKRRIEDVNQMTIAILSPEILRYRKALLMLRVLDLLGTGVRGRIQLQKCMFAAECLLNMPFHTQFIRYEHGPYDPDLPNIEEIINAKGWYTVLKGSPVSYQKGKQFEEGLREYMDTFSEIDLKLEKIVDFLRPMKTSQAERVATLLAAWNDFIIDGVSHPTDKEIIGEVVTNWTPNKANPQYSTWQDTLFKMREHRFVPKGSGVHTLQKEA